MASFKNIGYEASDLTKNIGNERRGALSRDVGFISGIIGSGLAIIVLPKS